MSGASLEVYRTNSLGVEIYSGENPISFTRAGRYLGISPSTLKQTAQECHILKRIFPNKPDTTRYVIPIARFPKLVDALLLRKMSNGRPYWPWLDVTPIPLNENTYQKTFEPPLTASVEACRIILRYPVDPGLLLNPQYPKIFTQVDETGLEPVTSSM